jgi:hypothetical protein
MSTAQSNAIEPVVAKRWVGEIESKFDELDSERGSYMSRCKGIREQIKELKQAAENAGVPRRGLNHLLKRRTLAGKLKAHEDDAEPEVVETADMIDDALGGEKGMAGLPLGAAAGGSAPDDEPDLRGKQQQTREAQRKADAAERLSGMKETPKKRGRPRKGAAPLVGDDTGSAPMTGEDEGAPLH